VVASQKALASARQNLNALERLRTNRFLTGNLLDTLQKVYVEDVRVVKLKTEFAYQKTAATPAKTNAFTVTPGTPETATERIKVQIEAIDASSTAGDNVNAYKEAATALASIDSSLDGQESEIRLTGLNPPQTDPSGRQFVLFTLECPYPEKVR
jgi:hypothetical protein